MKIFIIINGYFLINQIFLIDNQTVWKDLENYINNKHPKNFYAMIWIEYIKDIDFYYPEYPVFIADVDTFQTMTKYDIDNEKGNGNYFINIFCKIFLISDRKNLIKYPLNYLWYVSLSNLLLGILVTFLWHYNTFYKNYSNTHALQKILSVLPYLKFILGILVLYYVYIAKDDFNQNTESIIKVYLETIITTLESIFKTVFWFLFIMISWGWQVYRQNLNRNELRKFIGIYIFIYLSVCFDQILDLMVNKPIIFDFDLSEIKNFIIYSFLTVTVIYKTIGTIMSVKRKLIYAQLLSLEYIPALNLKIRMLISHLIIVCSYSVLYIVMTSIQKTFFLLYSSAEISLVNNNTLELLIITLYIWIFRSRKFPLFFSIEFNVENERDNSNLYLCKVPSLGSSILYSTNKSSMNLNYNNKNILKEKHSSPFIIINPVFREQSMSPYQINRSDSIDTVNNFNHTINDKILVGMPSIIN